MCEWSGHGDSAAEDREFRDTRQQPQKPCCTTVVKLQTLEPQLFLAIETECYYLVYCVLIRILVLRKIGKLEQIFIV